MEALSALERLRQEIGPGVQLLAVSKQQSPERIEQLYREGQRDFGENYVQELLAKWALLRDRLPGIRFHLIGRLQTNKVKSVISAIEVIHSIDSIRLLQEVDRRAKEAGRNVGVYFQINIDSEPSKGGFTPEGLGPLMEVCAQCTSVRPLGLMCIPDPERDPQAAFARMRELSVRVGGVLGPGLSMGMSGDYLVAIRAGATCVRIGSLLFGPRV